MNNKNPESNFDTIMAKIDVSLSNLKKSIELNNSYTEAEKAIILFYPFFSRDYQILLSHNYIIKSGDRVKWLKSKQCLAEYFGYQTKTHNWKYIEAFFGVKNLKKSFYSANKTSIAYDELCILIPELNKSLLN